MSYPYDTPTLDALTRLGTYYSGGNYDAGSNPGGFGAGGHRQNFIPALQDLALVGASVEDAGDAAAASAVAAAASAVSAASLATAITGTSTSSVSIGTGSKSFTTQAGKSFEVGSFVLVESDASPTTHYMAGQVTAYAGTALTINVSASSGSGTRTDWTILGRTGSPGVTGPIGATGPSGATPALQWTFGAATADADPGSGIILINNATYASATSLYVDNLDANGATQTTFLDSLDDSTNTALRGTLILQQIDTPSIYAVFNVTGAVTDGTGYRKVAVTPVISNGTFVAGHVLAVSFSRTGNKGADGAGAGDVISDIGSVVDGRIAIFNGTDGKHITSASFGIGTSGSNIAALSTNNIWGGTQSFANTVDLQKSVQFTGAITPSQITGNTDNYAPTGHADAVVFRLSSDASRNLTGLAGGLNGRFIIIMNVGSFDIVLKNDVTSTSANRFLMGGDFVLALGQQLAFVYDGTASRWKPVGEIGLGGDGLVSRPAYSFANDTDSGMYRIGANNLGFAVNGALVLAIAAAGVTITGTLDVSGIATGPTAASGTSTTQLATTAFVQTAIQANTAPDNLIINGAMEVSQEKGTTAQTGIAALAYVVDMFNYNLSGTGVVTLQQVADAPSGFKYSAKVSITTADAAMASTDTYGVTSSIEGYRIARLVWGTASARSVSLGFWVKAHRTGIYCVNFRNSAFDRSYVAEYTVSVADTWEYKTVTVAGDTSGTWLADNSLGIIVGWALAGGSTKQTTAGAWAAGNFTITSNQVIGVAATSDTFQLTGVSLVVGSVPVPQAASPLAVPLFEEELFMCQRYYEKSFNYEIAPAQNAGLNIGEHAWTAAKAGATSQRGAEISYKVKKRGFGNMTFYNPSTASAQVRDVDAGADCSGMTVVTGSQSTMVFSFTGNAATVVGNLMAIHWVADARF